jgi:hypothetical protein
MGRWRAASARRARAAPSGSGAATRVVRLSELIISRTWSIATTTLSALAPL